MVKRILPLILMITISGCTTANMVRSPHYVPETSKFGPINEEKRSSGVGIVSYLASGADFVIKARREDAYKKMYKECDGKYAILDEETEEGMQHTYAQTLSTGAVIATTGASVYKYIYFQCL